MIKQGDRFGRLTVVKYIYSKDGRRYWLCKCDCGNTKEISSNSLNNGKVQSCGCLREYNITQRLIKMTGEKCGKLTLLEHFIDEYGIRQWKCKCDCGKTCIVKHSLIKSQDCKSCGCLMENNLLNQKFNRLTVQEYSHTDKHHKKHYKCLCDCGKTVTVRADKLKNNHTKSCGCQKIESTSKLMKETKTIHGFSNTKIYQAYKNIKTRCYVESSIGFKNYGGRGIKMCEEWKNDFMSFYNWSINNGFKEGLEIDRIDVNKDYKPSNCRWVTRETQANNKRNTIYLTYNNEVKNLKQWSEDVGIPVRVLRSRYKEKWDTEKILTTPYIKK